jgi:hypothetical protein
VTLVIGWQSQAFGPRRVSMPQVVTFTHRSGVFGFRVAKYE